MNDYLRSLVLGFMIIGFVTLYSLGITASAQNQSGGMVSQDESSAGTAPGYVHVRSVREVNATADQVLGYFMNIQDLPRFHPEFIKNITILEQQPNNITFEQDASFFGNNVSSINKLTKLPSDNEIIIETINGSGRGSNFSLTWQEISSGTIQITLDGEFVFQSPPGMPLDDIIRNVAEKRLDEDVIHIERISSSEK